MARCYWAESGRPRDAWVAACALVLLALNLLTSVSEASAINYVTARAPIANGIPLRVLPIGDSITYGAPSEPYNGYRKDLLDKLTGRGNTVDYVGSIRSGNFSNNENEGHRGKIIDEIANMSSVGIWAAPNVVLLHAGTNDINRNVDVSNAPARLSKLIGLIYSHSPDAAVFVAQIVPTKTASTTAKVKTYNSAIPGVVDEWARNGKHITLVDIFDAVNADTDLADNLHPNPQGYSKMAQKWYDAITAADSKGWIVNAGVAQTPPSQSCGSANEWQDKGEIATGPHAAYPDAPFVQSWDAVGTFSTNQCAPSRLFFPDLDGDGFGDWACVGEEKGDVLAFLQQPTDGKPNNHWKSMGTLTIGKEGRHGSGVLFADLNGDGRDDYIYVENGNVSAWINGGLSGDTLTWNSIGVINGNDVGATRENLQLVDIDGDGRADFLIVDNDTGAVTAWLNGGPNDLPQWYKIGQIATEASKTKTADDIVIFGDFTGNGKADYMLVGKNGKVIGLANFIQERGFVPNWAPKVTVAGGPSGATQQYVRLVDVNGDGKVDYLLLDENGGSKLWINTGKGGQWQIGDGVFLADLNGDGIRDYIWSDGSVNILGYLSDGQADNKWDNVGQVKTTNKTWDLRHVRVATITNSNRSDIILIDNEQGACQWSQNLGPATSGAGYNWKEFAVLATGPKHTIVDAPYNWRWDSTKVQFADLTGDGLDDYLYVNTNGAVLMWKNQGTEPPSWGGPQLIAAGPRKGVWWTEIQFADTDGDGHLDYVHIDRLSGDAEVWRNLGLQADGSIKWEAPTPFAAGHGNAGYSARIVDMTGDGRADYISVDPRTGGLTLWQNACPAAASSKT